MEHECKAFPDTVRVDKPLINTSPFIIGSLPMPDQYHFAERKMEQGKELKRYSKYTFDSLTVQNINESCPMIVGQPHIFLLPSVSPNTTIQAVRLWNYITKNNSINKKVNCFLPRSSNVFPSPPHPSLRQFLSHLIPASHLIRHIEITVFPSADMFEIDKSGVIRVKAGAILDFESQTGTTVFIVTVRVIDNMDMVVSCPKNYDVKLKSCFAEQVSYAKSCRRSFRIV